MVFNDTGILYYIVARHSSAATFTNTFHSCIVVTAKALPGSNPLFRPRDDGNLTSHGVADPPPDITDTCDGIESKTADAWNKYNVGSWFVTMYDISTPLVLSH
jgi:hypothetical protein